MIALGLGIAIAVNNAAKAIKGQIIFVSLLPFIITPVIGALSIRWLFYGDGIATAMLERLLGTDISVASNGWAVEVLMMSYRVWHVAPFAFVIFYAGLQTVNQDTLESAVVDGASRWERLRYVVIPHLMPLIVFVTLIHLMDAYRAFEEVVGFSSQAQRITLQWLTYDLMEPDNSGNRFISSASASAMLTMVGIVLILVPPPAPHLEGSPPWLRPPHPLRDAACGPSEAGTGRRMRGRARCASPWGSSWPRRGS